MIVIVVTACPSGLRGYISRWLLEVSPGVFVGHASARVRERLWANVAEMIGTGRALLVYSVRGEQKLAFEVLHHDWVPESFDGLQLIRRPPPPETVAPGDPTSGTGWSVAGRARRFHREAERIRRSAQGS